MGDVITGSVWEDGLRSVVQSHGGNLALTQALDQDLVEFWINDVNDMVAAADRIDDCEGQASDDLMIVPKPYSWPIGR